MHFDNDRTLLKSVLQFSVSCESNGTENCKFAQFKFFAEHTQHRSAFRMTFV